MNEDQGKDGDSHKDTTHRYTSTPRQRHAGNRFRLQTRLTKLFDDPTSIHTGHLLFHDYIYAGKDHTNFCYKHPLKRWLLLSGREIYPSMIIYTLMKMLLPFKVEKFLLSTANVLVLPISEPWLRNSPVVISIYENLSKFYLRNNNERSLANEMMVSWSCQIASQQQ